MKTLFDLNLKITDDYKKIIMGYVYILTIFVIILFVHEGPTINIFDLFVGILLGQFFYDFVVKYLISL